MIFGKSGSMNDLQLSASCENTLKFYNFLKCIKQSGEFSMTVVEGEWMFPNVYGQFRRVFKLMRLKRLY